MDASLFSASVILLIHVSGFHVHMYRFFWVGPKVCLGFSVLQDNPNELLGQLDTIAGYTYHAVHCL